jgi:hypothetical protein
VGCGNGQAFEIPDRLILASDRTLAAAGNREVGRRREASGFRGNMRANRTLVRRHMSILGKYDLYEIVNDDETRTFKARESPTGRGVLVHQFVAGRTPPDKPDLLQLVLRYLRSASAESLGLILDMGEHEGSMYVVTEDLPGLRILRSWLESELAKPPTGATAFWRPGVLAQIEQRDRPAAQPAPEAQGSGPAGDMIFRPASQEDSTILAGLEVSAAVPLQAAEGSLPQVEPVPPERVAGEVTRVFHAWREQSRVEWHEPEVWSGESTSSEAQAEATRTFHPVKPADSQPAEPQEAVCEPLGGTSPAPGEFTSIFGAAPTSGLSGAEVNRLETAKPPFAPTSEPGEFTRLFQAASVSPEKPPSAQPPVVLPAPGVVREPGEFTRLFRPQPTPIRPPIESTPGGPASAPVPQPTATPGGQGEFTRLFGPASSAEVKPPKLGVQEPQPPPGRVPDHTFSAPQAVPKAAPPQVPRRPAAPMAVPQPVVSPLPSPRIPAVPQPAVAVPPPPTPKPGPSPLLLAIVLGALSLAGVALVLLLLLRR